MEAVFTDGGPWSARVVAGTAALLGRIPVAALRVGQVMAPLLDRVEVATLYRAWSLLHRMRLRSRADFALGPVQTQWQRDVETRFERAARRVGLGLTEWLNRDGYV